MLKTFVQQGRWRIETGGVPRGYVEDFDEPRTKLAGVFSILQEVDHHQPCNRSDSTDAAEQKPGGSSHKPGPDSPELLRRQ